MFLGDEDNEDGGSIAALGPNNLQYSESRMSNLINIISRMIYKYCIEFIGNDILSEKFSIARRKLTDSLRSIGTWEESINNFMNSWNRWKGVKLSANLLTNLKSRFSEILQICLLSEEIISLLTTADEKKRVSSALLLPFSKISVVGATQEDWSHSLEFFQRVLQPLETQLSSFLRKRLSAWNSSNNPESILNELIRYPSVLGMKQIATELMTERESLVGRMIAYIGDMKIKFESRMNDFETNKTSLTRLMPNSSPIVEMIVWLYQMRVRVKSTSAIVKKVLSQVNGEQNFQDEASSLESKLNESSKSLYDKWVLETTDSLTDKKSKLALQTRGALIEFDIVDGSLKVNYSEQLVIAQRDVRQLSELGFKVPPKIVTAAETAEKHALKLKQVANFYNTASDQIIKSQQGLLLSEVDNFEEVVKTQSLKKTSWENVDECEQFVALLTEAAQKLTTRNRKLRSIHNSVLQSLSKLLSIDLKNNSKWISGFKQIKLVFEKETRGCNSAAVELWATNLDHQLYKILEYQYRASLFTLSSNLPDLSAELVFKNKKIEFKPSLDTLRRNYYKNLKTFLDFPAEFKGFSEKSPFYRIPEANSEGLQQVYLQAEDIFSRLNLLITTYSPFVILGSIDSLEEFASSKLFVVSDWEININSIRKKREDLKQIPESAKIDCVQVSLLPLKLAIEDQLSRFNEFLLVSLKKSIFESAKSMDNYVNESFECLNRKPDAIDAMNEFMVVWKRLSDSKDEMEASKSSMEEKNNLLISLVSKGVEISAVIKKWESLVQRLTSFQQEMEDEKQRSDSEILLREISKFCSRWSATKPKEVVEFNSEAAQVICSELKAWRFSFNDLESQFARMKKQCDDFKLKPMKDDDLVKTNAEISQYEESWFLYSEFANSLATMSDELWINFRTHIYDLEDFGAAFIKRIKAREKASADLVSQHIIGRINELKLVFPLLKLITGENFEKEHWSFLFHKVLKTDSNISTLTLNQLINSSASLISSQQLVKDLAARAQGEVTLREALSELQLWQQNAEFKFTKERVGIKRKLLLITEWRELLTQVGDQQSLLASLKDSPFFGPFKDVSNQYESKFILLGSALQLLNGIQRKWVYLEPIFARGALPGEQQRFQKIDNEFSSLMTGFESSSNVMSLLDLDNTIDTLQNWNDQFERCQKALADFLEEKRSLFPRFYFLGDDDLLEILGQASNPAVIQTHLKKLFAGIASVGFDDKCKSILSMNSAEGEKVILKNPIPLSDAVEQWLLALAAEMQNTLIFLLSSCLSKYDLIQFPSQVVGLYEVITFTKDVEEAIKNNKLAELKQKLLIKLQKLTAISNADSINVLKIKSLVLDIIHHVDVVDQLINAKCTNITDWAYQKQIRYYFAPSVGSSAASLIVRMVDASFSYSFEYLGNYARLVHTPLTDKCYLVLTQGMHLGYGGNPYGPAGTGKTESVKALGCALGRQVLVFNCDEGIDFQAMGRILMGLVKSGAWGCFDEFNRLKEDQLSAISQQIQVIQSALKNKEAQIELLEQNVTVNFHSGIFVTMNPAGKEYGGRSKLPDNLKQLFRAVAMSVPDLNLIAEVILYSEGFSNAKELGLKLVSIYSLAKQLLSPQKHYDWGLRALKTVLACGGSFIQAERLREASNKEGSEAITFSLEKETELLVQALNINTQSKLTFSDTTRFNSLVLDVFPNLDIKQVEYKTLESCVKKVLEGKKLEFISTQFDKILQLYEGLQQRMGCIIVGPSGCGKSTLLNVLHEAMALMGNTIHKHVFNPKSMDRNKLLGHMDHDTREWFDGVLTASARQVMKETSEVKDKPSRSWIVCDGDVDPEWIESLNSVLDDNRLLTLPNGERIQFRSEVNFIFECHDLQFASPATISRASMIYLSDEAVDIKYLVESWLLSQNPKPFFVADLFDRAVDFVKNCELVVKATLIGVVRSALTHCIGVTNKTAFALSVIRGLGSNLTIEKRTLLAKDVFSWSKLTPPDTKNLLDYFCNENGQLAAYKFAEPVINYSDLSLNNPPLVNTIDMQKNYNMLLPYIKNCEPILLVGPEGCGKSLLFSSFCQKSFSIATLNCSAQSNATHVIQLLMDSCMIYTTNTGRVLRPKEGERLILYLKDVNLPCPDKYQTSQLISFLQQLITYKGFYDDNLEWLGLERIQIVSQMNPIVSVGRYELSSRFTAICRILSISYSDKIQNSQIYSCYLRAILSHGKVKDSKWMDPMLVSKLASTLVEIQELINSKFSVEDYRHYLFTTRDLTLWVFGLLRYDLRHDIFPVLLHEAFRIFGDRCVDSESLKKFSLLLTGVINNRWKDEKVTMPVPYRLSKFANSSSSGSDMEMEPIYTSFGVDEGHSEMGFMMENKKYQDYHEMVSSSLQLFEREVRDLNIILFPEVLYTISYLDRVLSRPGGSLLLVGDSGCGRRSATSLIAYMRRFSFISPLITRNYTMKQFKVELKEVLRLAGAECKHTVLYLEDYQIVEPSILESVNSLLSSGEIPGLFTPQELDALLAPLKDKHVAGKGSSLYSYFVQNVRANLHIVLSFDSSHPQFGTRTETNPSLKKCTVIWNSKWTNQGLHEVPRIRLKDLLVSMEEKDREGFLNKIKKVYDTLGDKKSVLFKPRKYTNFVSSIVQVYDNIMKSQKESTEHLLAGLNKLRGAEEQVRALQVEASQQQELLSKKQRDQDDQMNLITQKIERSLERRREVDEFRKLASKEESEAQVQKSVVEEELAAVNPILEASRNAVGDIRKDSLAEMKAYKMPPPAIADILTAVFTLLGLEDLSWNGMKSFLGSPNMKDQIIHFDARTVNPRIRSIVQDLIEKKPDSFDDKKVARVNVSAAPLAAWVRANVAYSFVLEKIQPLTDSLNVVEKSLAGVKANMTRCENEAKELDDEKIKLQQAYNRTTAEAEVVRQKFQKATDTLAAAAGLLGKLSGEKNRWETQVKELKDQLHLLPYHSILSAAFINFLGGEAEDQRKLLMNKWVSICLPGGFNEANSYEFLRFLSTESQILKWKSQELPSDALSLENALILSQNIQTPFVIDPGMRASYWLKRYWNEKIEVIAQQDPKFVNSLELAVRFGKTLIVTEVDKIEPILIPILRKDIQLEGSRRVIIVGDKKIDFADTFKLLLLTRNSFPEISPDISALITEVNFTVTFSGLEEQLLGITLKHENPELEGKKSELLKEEELLKIQLGNLEKELLLQLANAQGNILENIELINSLDTIKSESLNVTQKIAKAKEVQITLDKQREVYRPIANLGSEIFFLMESLKSVSNMYQFSLPAFSKIFNSNLDFDCKENDKTYSNKQSIVRTSSQAPPTDHARLNMLKKNLKTSIFSYVTRSLFKCDRVMFAMHFAHLLNHQMCSKIEWDFFLGEVIENESSSNNLTLPSWASPICGPNFKLFSTLFPSAFRICQFSEEFSSWKRWGENAACEQFSEFPLHVQEHFTPFQRLLLLQVLRPDRLLSGMTNFAVEVLELESLSPSPLVISSLHQKESVSYEPLLFITTPGADPSQELQEFSFKTVGKKSFTQIAMGQGQTAQAITALRDAARLGHWLLLKNLHLVTPWLYSLEKELTSLKPHDSFRLFLTTEAHDNFPSMLLRQSLKITYESPPGLRENLVRTYSGWSREFIGQGSNLRAQMLFILAWFHAICQERRNYIPQGWTKFYEFSTADVRAGADVISSICNSSPNVAAIPWNTVWGLMENAIYGGRIDNNNDIRILLSYLNQYFNPDIILNNGNSARQLTRGLQLPNSNKWEEYMNIASALPSYDSPSVFGLPSNIEGILQRTSSLSVIAQLKKLQVSSILSSKFDRELWKKLLQPFLTSWQSLVNSNQQSLLQSPPRISIRKDSDLTPIDSFVLLESQKAYDLVSKIESFAQELTKILAGGALSSNAYTLGKALLSSEVPWGWEKEWGHGPQFSLVYIKEVASRKAAVNRWMERTENNTLLSQPIRLSDVLNASTFLNAFLQHTARISKNAIDKLKLVCAFDKVLLPNSPLVLQIEGLLVQGCSFSNGTLVSVDINSPAVSVLPNLYISWVPKSEPECYKLNESVVIPVYSTLRRDSNVCELRLPCSGNSQSWIVAGAALFLTDFM